MWFGTEDGLNKYDGKRFKIYRPDPANPNSLSYKWTELIYEDSFGNLWFGSKGGLSKFDPKKEIFTRYGSQNQKNRIAGDSIMCLEEAGNKSLWIGTKSGLNIIDLNVDSIVFSGLKGLKINTIKSFADEIWVGTDRGIYVK
jgi:ligand-binding sensor domain-containing protein